MQSPNAKARMSPTFRSRYPLHAVRQRALIIDEKYVGRDKKFVTCVIDGGTGEILWLKEGKGTASLDGFFRSLTPEQKEDIEVVRIDRGNAYLKALREHLPHVSISFDPFHIIKNVNDAVDEVRRDLCKSLEKEEKKASQRKALLVSLRGGESD